MRKIAYGINTQNRSMYPCAKEVAQTVAVATIVYGLKYKQSKKSRKPYSKDIAQCLSAGCHDASVVKFRKKGLEECAKI